MKKILAILLLCILLFNWVGYRLFTAYVETKSSLQLVADFDNKLTDLTEMISVKIPSSLPYYTGTGEFEKAVGKIEINQVQYNYVQRKVTHDSIEYICVVNKAGTAIKNASDKYFKLVNDLGHSAKKDSPAKIKMLKLDYCQADAFVFSAPQIAAGAINCDLSDRQYYSLAVAPPDLPPNNGI